MRSALIDAIRTGDRVIMQLFAEPFDHRDKWVSFLDQHLKGPGARLSVGTILGMAERWHSYRFQALYVACWIYHPLEKGSYMIQLNPQQTAVAAASVAELTWRLSSHLSETSRSARGGKDFEFIRGYGELLVILEGNFLFLKMEGHAASSPSHLSSWVTKMRTNIGDTASPQLHGLTTDARWGIQQRGAENYSKSYKALLKVLGFSGRTVNFSQVVAKLRQQFPTVAVPAAASGAASLRGYFARLYRFGDASASVRSSTLYARLLDAREDLKGILDDLEQDEQRLELGTNPLGLDRIYREIRVAPDRLDDQLDRFYRALKAPDLLTVQLINEV